MTVRPGARAAVAAISACEGAHEARLVDRGVADMAVEVAIRALRQAERPVDVDAEAPSPASAPAQDSASASLRKARARCDRPCAVRRQAVLLLGASSRRTCGRGRRAGTSDRSRSPGRRAAARPACRRPRPRTPRRGRRARRRTAPRRNARARCSGVLAPRSHQHGLDLVHREAEILVRPGPARRVDAGLAVERIDARPESSANAGSPDALRGGLAP